MKQNFQEAFLWYRNAALSGNAFSQFRLGLMHEKGFGVEKDHIEAMNWIKKAAFQKHSAARLYLDILNK